jgi:hypothetical protein
VTVCPHCKKQFAAKNMEIELIQGTEEEEMKFGKVAYSCPNCHVFLAVGEIAEGVGGGDLFKMGMENFIKND